MLRRPSFSFVHAKPLCTSDKADKARSRYDRAACVFTMHERVIWRGLEWTSEFGDRRGARGLGFIY